MLEQFCDDFLAVVPLQLPELLDKRKMEKPVKYDDYVLLTFQLNTPFTIEEVMDMLEDEMEMIILYHHIPSRQTEFGHSCCAYSNPSFGRMFKVNGSTDERGMVSQIKVTIYDSLEHMSADVCLDLSLHCKNGFLQCRLRSRHTSLQERILQIHEAQGGSPARLHLKVTFAR